MITYGNSGLSTLPLKTNRQLLYIEIYYNSEKYDWAVYTPAVSGQALTDYLNANKQVYENDIQRKLDLWAANTDPDITKDMIVRPDVPDYQELNSEVTSLLESIKRLMQQTSAPMVLSSSTLNQQDLDDLALIYPYYEVGKAYVVDEVFSFEGKLYRTVQAHTSQADWYPPTTPALYTAYTPAGTIAEWVQPTGAQDAYHIGDKVTHDGFTWESLIDANVWEPGAPGTESLWVKI